MNKFNILTGASRVAGTAGAAIGTGFLVDLLPDCVPQPVKNGLVVAAGTLGDVVACGICGSVLCKSEARKYEKIQVKTSEEKTEETK